MKRQTESIIPSESQVP